MTSDQMLRRLTMMNDGIDKHNSFAHYLQSYNFLTPIFEKLQRCITIMRSPVDNNSIGFEYNLTSLSLVERRIVSILFGDGREFQTVKTLGGFVNMHLFSNGPKVFRPTMEELEALEEIEIKLPISAYSQPFPTFVVEFPRSYSLKHEVVSDVDDRTRGEHYWPVAVIIHHDAKINALLTVTVCNASDGMTLCSLLGNREVNTIEDDLSARLNDDSNDMELSMLRRSMRASLNACLLLMEKGFKRFPADAHHRRLESFVTKARKRGESTEKPERDLRLLPIHYTFSQQVDIRRMVGSRLAVESMPTGRRVRPHWRSAHWRLQHYGPGNSQTKRLFIEHVLVNADLFGGSPSNTSYEAK